MIADASGGTLPDDESGAPTPESASGKPPGAVLVVTPWYRPSVGGVAEMAERLHTGLNAAGAEAHLLVKGRQERRLTPIEGIERGYRMRLPGFEVALLNPRKTVSLLVRGTAAYRRIRRYVRAHGIRTIFVLYPIDYAWPFPLLRREADCRVIPVLQGNDVEAYASFPAAHRWLLRQVLRRADAVVACASHLGASASRIAGRALPVHVIPNCVDTRHFTPSPSDHRRRTTPPTLVHVSNFAPKKRTTDIVTAFARARLPASARLIMVGDGPTYAETRALAADLGVDDRISFVGAQTDVRPFFWDADVFVLASESEGAPLVLTETMACGVPWISTAWGAAADAVAGACGIVVPPRDADAMAAAMERLLGDPALRDAMAARCRRVAEQHYSRDSYIRRHVELVAK